MKEFKAEWDNLRANVDLFLSDLDSGKDPDKSGTEVKKSSYRLSLLCEEIVVFNKRMRR